MMKMRNLLKYILLTFSVPLFTFCGEESEPNPFADRPFALVTATDGDRTSISAEVDDSNRTIAFLFSKQTDLTAVRVNFQLNPGYTMVTPDQSVATLNLSQEQSVVIRSSAGEVSYRIVATNDTPVLSATLLFRKQTIHAVIDNESRTITFPIDRLIYSSEYPSELLAAVALDLTLGEGFKLTKERTTFDLVGGESIALYKGRNTYTYQLAAAIDYLPVTNHLAQFNYRRGVNLTYWMTEDDRNWLEAITPEMFPLWKELGFDHYRVPVWEFCLYDKTSGAANEKAFRKLHELFTWCEQNGMYAILDMHELGNYDEKKMYDLANPEYRNHFVELWRKLATEFKDHDRNHLAFELLNEPGDGTQDGSAWNKLQKEVMTAIREQDPERIVFVPAMDYQNYNYIKYAQFAEQDPNVVVSYHYYLPMLLSHYKSLAWKDYQGAIQYPGTVIPTKADADKYPKFASFYTTTYNADRIMGEMGNAASDGRNIGHAIHCGEFGCSKNVPESMRLQWFADMVAALEANGIPWTLWECLGGGFGFVDEDWGFSDGTHHRINCPLLKILTGKEMNEAEAKDFLEKYGFKTY